jgi:hypothetical protein
MRLALMDTSAAASPLLRAPRVRAVLIAIPTVTALAAVVSALLGSLVAGLVLGAIAAAFAAGALLLAIASIARESIDIRVLLAQTVEDEQWHARAQRLSSQHHKNGRIYADWYFRLRLQEELERAKRHHLPLTLLIARKPGPPIKSAEAWLDTEVDKHLRRTDLPAILRDGSLGVILHHTAHFNAVRDRIAEGLASFDASVGFAVFPKDGEDVSSMLRAADAAAQEDARPREHRLAA